MEYKVHRKPVFIINGSGGCGKDTLVNLINEFIPVKNFSSVDKVKQIAKEIGWDGITKDDKVRKLLSDLKRITTDFNDMSFIDIKREVEDFKKGTEYEAMFIHIREINEIERAKEEFNATTILVQRESIEKITTNQSDANVANYDYDIIIDNNGTIDELRNDAKYIANIFIK